MICDNFYNALALAASDIENSVPEMPEHKFSLRYRRRKKLLIKAYERSIKTNGSISEEYKRPRSRSRLRLTVLILVLLTLLITGGSVYFAYNIGGFSGYRQSTHTDISFEDWEGSPETLYPVYYLTYDMSGWDKEILSDTDALHSEMYRRGDAYVSYSRMDSDIFYEKYPDFDYEALFYSNDSTVQTEKYELTILDDGSERLIWTDDYTFFELRYSGIPTETGTEIYRSVYAPTYRITCDMSGWEKENMTDNCFHKWDYYEKGDCYFSFSMYIKEMYQNVRLNTEGTELETRYVNGHEAMYCMMRDSASQYLCYDNGDYIFEFGFDIDYDEVLKIIESIKIQ